MYGNYQRLVIKIGTNVLTDVDGTPDLDTMAHLVEQIAGLREAAVEVIVVSSGAVGMGRSVAPGFDHLPRVLRRQVLSALGQTKLMQLYQEFFRPYGFHVAQVLATKEDFRDRRHYLNMKHCLQGLLRGNIIPVVNENDVVSVTELMFTDNDELAGLVAAMVNAEALLILSNVDGVFDGPPQDPASRLLPEIDPTDQRYQQYIQPSTSSFGRGGMHTKFRIAGKAARLGITTIIANGKKREILPAVLSGTGAATRFRPKKRVSNLKKWLAHHSEERKAAVFINAGAATALRAPGRVSSLLPVGIIRIEGDFEKGDIVSIRLDEQEVGIGMAQYSAVTARKYLGQKGKKPLVHYDYLIMNT